MSTRTSLLVSESLGECCLSNIVRVELPAGTTILAAQGHGASNWTRTARVDTRSVDGVEKSYFLKVAPGSRGRGMMLGEYESMTAIYKIVPTFVPRPIAWGTFEVLNRPRFLCALSIARCTPKLMVN